MGPKLAIGGGALKLPAKSGRQCVSSGLRAQGHERARQVVEELIAEGQTCLREIWMAETKADAEAAFEHSLRATR